MVYPSAPPLSTTTMTPTAPPPVHSAYVYGSEEEHHYQQQQQLLQQHYQQQEQHHRRPKLDERKIRSELRDQGYTRGLCQMLCRSLVPDCPLRIWIVDNSGSMNAPDGQRLVETKRRSDVRLARCTRWEELVECVSYHCQMAALLAAPTTFRLLNHPGGIAAAATAAVGAVGSFGFGVAQRSGRRLLLPPPPVGAVGCYDGTDVNYYNNNYNNDDDDDEASIQAELDAALRTLHRVHPRGVTPLTEHVLAVRSAVESMSSHLRATGRRVAVVIATDGLPSDDEGHGGRAISDQFVGALRLLGSLPISIVIRLCTDDEEVCRFYHELDCDGGEVELSLEVLDDFVQESAEVYRQNPWLNYSLPLHRCREMGWTDPIFDLLDERPLTRQEVSRFCCLLFGEDAWYGEDDDQKKGSATTTRLFASPPDPDVDWKGFAKHVEALTTREEKQWNPTLKKVAPCILLKELRRMYGDHNDTERWWYLPIRDVRLFGIILVVLFILSHLLS